MGWKFYKCRRPNVTWERAEVWGGEDRRGEERREILIPTQSQLLSMGAVKFQMLGEKLSRYLNTFTEIHVTIFKFQSSW
jgi:hypothetical protein